MKANADASLSAALFAATAEHGLRSSVAGQVMEAGPAAMIDDLLAAARPWGFDVAAPVPSCA